MSQCFTFIDMVRTLYSAAMLSADPFTRYTRQMMFQDWGIRGQEKLLAATVFIAGAGGLGSPVAFYLAAAGVGRLRLCDDDVVDCSNLNRQILHAASDIGRLKVESAQQKLQNLNPTIQIEVFSARIEPHTVEKLVGASDVIVDCLDNFPTRILLSRYAVQHQLPFIYGGVWGMEGMVSVFHPPDTPCLECVFPQAPESKTFPIIGATPGIIGAIQAMETLKYLVGIGDLLKGKLLTFDGKTMTFQAIQVIQNPNCPVCSKRR